MPRASVVVRRAVPDDVPALRRLLAELRDHLGPAARPALREATAVEERLTCLVGDGASSVLVAERADGNRPDVVGMTILTAAPVTSLTDVPTLRMDYTVVAERHRRQGIGHALLAAAADEAELRGMEQLAVGVMPTDREANRFYARLGFVPVVVRRSASLPALRRRLTAAETRVVSADVARRRLLRRGARARPRAAER